mmetsp:Transcript_13489/g.38364  ORF Transcript_13489/g.38364 Transcript_13489/m.38364 type:complete len:228 (-) Transcript_13489:446-1129(-)
MQASVRLDSPSRRHEFTSPGKRLNHSVRVATLFQQQAGINGAPPRQSSRVASAFASRRSRTTAGVDRAIATCSTVAPFMKPKSTIVSSRGDSTSARRPSSSLATGSFPSTTAQCRGVRPPDISLTCAKAYSRMNESAPAALSTGWPGNPDSMRDRTARNIRASCMQPLACRWLILDSSIARRVLATFSLSHGMASPSMMWLRWQHVNEPYPARDWRASYGRTKNGCD